MQNKVKKITTGANLRFSGSCGINHFHIGCVFVEYGLFNTTNLILNLVYVRFDIILTPFYLNFSRQEHRSTPEILRFQSIPPFIFPLQSL